VNVSPVYIKLTPSHRKIRPPEFLLHEELENFERNQVWTLVEPPRDVNVIGTKWVLKNK
jgi:hypothetical protein